MNKKPRITRMTANMRGKGYLRSSDGVIRVIRGFFFIFLLLRLHLKRRALHDAENKRRKAIIVSSRIANDRPNHGHVVIVYGPAERIRQKLLGCVGDKRIRPAYQ